MKRTVVVEASWTGDHQNGFRCSDDPDYSIKPKHWETEERVTMPDGSKGSLPAHQGWLYIAMWRGEPISGTGNDVQGAKEECYNHMSPYPSRLNWFHG
jgi:hypothetical protein